MARYNVWSVLIVAIKRLISQYWLSLAMCVGLVAAVALIVSIPLYADAVYYRVLVNQLTTRYESRLIGGPSTAAARVRLRPPFAFTFRYTGQIYGALEWEQIRPVDTYFTELAAGDLGLPQTLQVRHFRSQNLRLFPEDSNTYEANQRPLAPIKFAFADNFEQHIKILEGDFAKVSIDGLDDSVEVLVSESLAVELGLQIGETYNALPRQLNLDEVVSPIPVHIAGVWEAIDPSEAYWFYDPTSLAELFMVPEKTFQRISMQMNDEVELGIWYLVMDGSRINASDVPKLIDNITYTRQRVNSYLPKTELDESLIDALEKYQHATGVLTVLLYAFSIPVVGLLLAFIFMVASLAVRRQRNVIAILRSRGASTKQVASIAIMEGLLLGILGLVIGIPIGVVIARSMGKAQSFLTFTLQNTLRVQVTLATVGFGVGAVLLTLVAQVLPTITASRHTIVSYKQEHARYLRPPWWQRVWLDALLLIPVAYGAYILRQQGTVILPGMVNDVTWDPFQNPLLFLVPTLGILALSLLLVRILPKFTAVLGKLSSRFNTVGFLMAARHLSRMPAFATPPLLLLILTLSLSVYTASMAETLDKHLYDQVFYQTGAHMSLVELGENTEDESSSIGIPPISDNIKESGRWLFLPVSEHLKVQGVLAASRVGRYKAYTRLGSDLQVGTYMGIDRLDFPGVAYWRSDFAPVSLGTLMNALANQPNGILAQRSCMDQHLLRVGDYLQVVVDTYAQQNELLVVIVGTFDYFPTWYPQADSTGDGCLFVGNLDYLYEAIGGQYPYDVWLHTSSDVDYEIVVKGIRRMRIRVEEWESSSLTIAQAQLQPERQGLFGMLSVGFLATAMITVLGFLLYALFSFRQRFIELGVMRAVGLSRRQMIALLAWELILLILPGGVVGTVLGVGASRFFIPFMQFGADSVSRVPPFIVLIPWPTIMQIHILFGALFVVALAGYIVLLLRMQVFRAIKLGETV